MLTNLGKLIWKGPHLLKSDGRIDLSWELHSFSQHLKKNSKEFLFLFVRWHPLTDTFSALNQLGWDGMKWNNARMMVGRCGKRVTNYWLYERANSSHWSIAEYKCNGRKHGVASRGRKGGSCPPPVKKPPLKNNRNQNTYLNILGILGMESYDFR